jgi:hypothetical protein
MRSIVMMTLVVVLGMVPVAGAQATRPSSASPDPRLELRANQAFNRGEYATALPMLKTLAEAAKNEPSRLGALQEKIRVCQKALDSLKANPTPALTDPQAQDIATDAESRKKHPKPKTGEVMEFTIKELGNFEYDDEKGGKIPADVRQLNGSEIKLRGFMIPMDQAENITQFALVPSLFACCFGQPPQIQHTIVVSCPKGKSLAYVPDEITVEGKLTVQEKKDDGYVISIFEVGADSVKVAK